MNEYKPGFNTLRRGFHITFENACTVSVHFGGGNYCDNYHLDVMSTTPPCANAEIAGWDKEGVWIRPDYEEWDANVRGYQTPAQVLKYMNYVASLP